MKFLLKSWKVRKLPLSLAQAHPFLAAGGGIRWPLKVWVACGFVFWCLFKDYANTADVKSFVHSDGWKYWLLTWICACLVKIVYFRLTGLKCSCFIQTIGSFFSSRRFFCCCILDWSKWEKIDKKCIQIQKDLDCILITKLSYHIAVQKDEWIIM